MGTVTREEQSDGQLIAQVRGGNTHAFDELYRRHRSVAIGTAHHILDNPSDAEDVVADSFAYLFSKLKEGQGPDNFFRGYLLTAVRRNSYSRNKVSNKTKLPERDEVLDQPVIDPDRLIEEFESGAIVRAFSALPERWQSVLWYLDVEQESTQSVAKRMGMTANSVSALVMRARDGLRAHYLQQHVVPGQDPECKPYVAKLAKYAAKTLSLPVRVKVEKHLDECAHCTAVLVNLRDSAPALRAALVPALVGISWLAYQSVASMAPLATKMAAGSVGSGVARLLHLKRLVGHQGVGALAPALTAAAGIAVAIAIPAFLIGPISAIQQSVLPSSIAQSALPGEQGQVGANAFGEPPALPTKSKVLPNAVAPGDQAPTPSVATLPLPSVDSAVVDQPVTAKLPVELQVAAAQISASGSKPSTPTVASPVIPKAPSIPTTPVAPSNPQPVDPAQPQTPEVPNSTDGASGTGTPVKPEVPANPDGSTNGGEPPVTELPMAASTTTVQKMLLGGRKLVTTVVFPEGVSVKAAKVTFQLDAISMFEAVQTEVPEGWACDRVNLRNYSCTATEASGTVVFEQVASYPDLSETPSLVVETTADNLKAQRQETSI